MNARSKIFAWISLVESGFGAISIGPSTSRMTTSAGTIGGCRIFCTAENKHTVKMIRTTPAKFVAIVATAGWSPASPSPTRPARRPPSSSHYPYPVSLHRLAARVTI